MKWNHEQIIGGNDEDLLEMRSREMQCESPSVTLGGLVAALVYSGKFIISNLCDDGHLMINSSCICSLYH